MLHGSVVNAYAFAFFFTAGFVATGKRPILALSTRAILIADLIAAFAYTAIDAEPWHAVAAGGAAILNVVFIACAAIDFVRWQRTAR